MDLEHRLIEDLKDAMRKGDVLRRETIRFLRAAIHNEEIEKGRPLTDAEAHGVIARLIRQHRESIQEFRKAGRTDLVEKEEAELRILESYMPKLMSREEIEAAVRQAIQETGAASARDQGKVMARLAAQLRGKADLAEVSQVVREVLTEAGA